MTSPLSLDPALFDPAAIPAETKKLNDIIISRLNAEPAGLTIQEVRARRLQGIGAFPLAPKSPRAETIEIDGPAGKIALRIIAPKSPRGIFFHIHGGGWSIGAPELNDPLLESLAEGCERRLRIGEVSAFAGEPLSGRAGRLRGGGAVGRARGDKALRYVEARDRRRVRRRASLGGHAAAPARQAQAHAVLTPRS